MTRQRSVAVDGVLLAIGTFTAVRVPPPSAVDRRRAGVAVALGPLVGACLGLAAAGVLQLADRVLGDAPLAAALAVATLALLTRGLHLDGLADTADGLGVRSGRSRALAAMREPGVGAFGVATLTLVLVVQVSAIAVATRAGTGTGTAALVLAVVTGRLAVALACVHGVPAARADGLGAVFAGCLPRGVALPLAVGVSGLAAVVGMASGAGPLRPVTAVAVGLLVAALVLVRCLRRLGGVTGDVFGAVAEMATTGALLVTVAAAP